MVDSNSGQVPDALVERPSREPRNRTMSRKALVNDQVRRRKKAKFLDYCAEPDDANASNGKDDIGHDGQLSAWIKTGGKQGASRASQTAVISRASVGSLPGITNSRERAQDVDIRRDSRAIHMPSGPVNKSAARPKPMTAAYTVYKNAPKVQPYQDMHSKKPLNSRTTAEVMSSDHEDDKTCETNAKDDESGNEASQDDDEEQDDSSASEDEEDLMPLVKPIIEVKSLSTPKRSMKKVLVGANTSHDDESPSKRASSRLSHKKTVPEDSTRRQLFSAERRSASPPTPVQDLMDIDPLVTPLAESPQIRVAKRQTNTSNIVKSNTKQTKTLKTIPNLSVSAEHVQQLKYNVMTKLTSKRKLSPQFRDAQHTAVHTLLRETIVRAESNSALLIGPSGTGKSLLVDHAIQSFKDAGHEFLVVRLNGMIQTDDRMALKTIAKQLQPDNEEIANADIMSALLAILSHPRDFGESDDPLSTVILLDHFEQFTEHPRQTLLYNLFDIAQSKKAPICVLGLTSRINSYDALEKRVKSRFSHRVIQFPHLNEDQFRQLSLMTLSCDITALADQEMKTYQKTWNEYITASEYLTAFITFTYLTTTNIQDFTTSLLPLISYLGTSDLYFAFPDFSTLLPSKTATLPLTLDSKLSLLSTLSLLELGMLISAARVEIKGGRINLMTTIDEHTALVQKSLIAQRGAGITTLRSVSSALCAMAWQKLNEQGLLVPQAGRLGAGSHEFKAVKVEIRLEEISALVKAEKIRVGQWMNSWLTLG